MLIGVIYCFVPYVTALTLQFWRTENENLADIVCRMALLLIFAMLILYSFLINYSAASITIRNKHLAKYLYQVFTDNYSINLMSKNLNKLKIDPFIDRLNKQFVGFRCFNLFKFTKLAFYQYYFNLSSTCILIYKFVNK